MKIVSINNSEIKLGLLSYLNKISSLISLPYPPIVAPYRDSLYLVDGCKRFNNNTSSVIISDSYTIKHDIDQILVWLSINTGHRKINELEKAVVVTKLSEITDLEEITDVLSPYFDIPTKMIPEYMEYLNLPLSIQKFIARSSPSRNVVRYILAAPRNIRESIAEILGHSNPNPPTLRLLVELASDINSKTGTNYLDSLEFNELIKSSGIKDAIQSLKKIRTPKLTSLKTRMEKEIDSIEKEILNIDFDDRFERPWFELSAKISKAKDIEKLLSDINLLIKNKTIPKLYKIYNDDQRY